MSVKQVIYLATNPIQHPGEKSRELPLRVCGGFTDLEAEHLYLSTARMEHYFEDVFRIDSVKADYEEVITAYDALSEKAQNFESDGSHNLQKTVIRRIDGYMLEVDLFLKHWEWYLQDRDRTYKEKIKKGFKPKKNYECGSYYSEHYKLHTSYAFDNSTGYALLAIIRNYLVHASGVVNCVHVGYKNVKIWCDRDLVANNKIVSKSKTRVQILKKQSQQIDLMKIIRDSYPVIKELQGRLLMLLYDNQLIDDCDFLYSKYLRTVLIPSVAWFVVECTESEFVNDPPPIGAQDIPYIGGASGLGINYVQLNWQGYQSVKKFKAETVQHKDDVPNWL